MKTAKEYIERMQNDKDFATQMGEKIKAAKEAGAKDVFTAVSFAAKELGYDVSPEQVKEISAQNEDISEEELGKVAGGSSCTLALSLVVVITVVDTVN